MSGAHRVHRSAPRLPLRPFLFARRVWAVVWGWHVARVAELVAEFREWYGARDVEDMWASVEATSPDPLPLPAPPQPAPAPAPAGALTRRLSPQDALRVLHTRHELPGVLLLWRIEDDVVSGEVNPLEGAAAERAAIVTAYAAALGGPVVKEPSTEGRDARVVVATSGEFAGVIFRVSTTDDALPPARVFEETRRDPTLNASLTTQGLPPSRLREVVEA